MMNLPWRFLPVLLVLVLPGPARADDWPQWLGPKRDGVWRETGILDKFPKGGPKILWRTEIGGGYAGPAVADGRVYLMDRQPTKPKEGDPPPPKGTLAGTERILCLDAASGKILWKNEYDCPYVKLGYPSGPRTTPVVAGGKVYTLGAMGDLYCLDAVSGKVHWSKSLAKEYKAPTPVWGWSANLLLDGDRLITLVGGEKSAVVALQADTGKETWRALTTQEVGYAPPLIVEAGGKRQLIVWLTDSVNALDPATGTAYWSEPYPAKTRPAVTVATPRPMGDLLFVTTFYHGSLMLKLAADKPAASVLWQSKGDNPSRPDRLHGLISTPVLKDGHVYGICAFGELRCLKADTGEQLWESLQPVGGKKALFGTVFLIQQGERFFLFNDQGDLIIARLTPKGYEEIDRAHLLEPTQDGRGRTVVWSHPAFANRCVFARNDKEILCASLAEKDG
jgi:outer membrane protein assembly factor BamB